MSGKASVVLIEDDDAVNEAVTMILKLDGLFVYSFFSIEEFNEATLPAVDLFIIDRQLKGSDGLDLCRQLKMNSTTKDLPVLIISASPRTEEDAIAAGADKFLAKPFARKQMLSFVENLLNGGQPANKPLQ